MGHKPDSFYEDNVNGLASYPEEKRGELRRKSSQSPNVNYNTVRLLNSHFSNENDVLLQIAYNPKNKNESVFSKKWDSGTGSL